MSLRYLSGNKLSSRRLNNFNATVTYPGAGADLNYGQTTTLLHGTGTNGGQNNTFLDGSSNAFTITRNGNTTQGSFSPFSQSNGYWSNYFNGDGSTYIQSPNINFSTNNFTIEGWFYIDKTTYPTALWGIDNGYGSNQYKMCCLFYNGTVYLYFGQFGYTTITFDQTFIPLYRWTHVALVRTGTGSNQSTFYVNGKSVVTGTIGTLSSITAPFTIGNGGESGYDFTGYISNFRVVNGTAVYTSEFTPSTTPLTAITNTALLTCQSNRFKDNSTNASTITVSGTPKTQVFCPLSSPTSYALSTNGGSGFFDGSGDYLLTSSSTNLQLGTSDFTLEYWIYTLSTNSNCAGVTLGDPTSTYAPLFGYVSGGNMLLYISSAASSWDIANGRTVISSMKANQWYHIAITRSGSSFKVFVNGDQADSFTSTASIYQGTNQLCVGRTQSSYYTNGYMSDVRFIKGTALYTSAFTPPTAPLTAISNTQFLCNFQNAAVLDNTGTNDFETITNASISTTQSKFGGSSIYFDGSSYLKSSTAHSCVAGTEDFTVDFWVYPTSFSSYGQILSNSSASGLGIAINTDGTIYYTKVSVTVLGTSTNKVTLNTWNHVAVVRYNGVIKIFVNGNIGYSASDTTSFTLDAIRIGLDLNGGSPFTGYLDEFRITKSIARYFYNFTVPTAAYYDSGYSTLPTDPTTDSYFGQTPLLLHGEGSSGGQNNTLLDSSSNAYTVTRNGNSTQGSFSPFSRAEGYWSNYFGGSQSINASASTDFQFSGDFTIEAWVYTTTGDKSVIVQQSSTNYFALNVNSGTGFNIYLNSSGATISPTDIIPQANRWNHIALVRSGSTVKVYLNGVASSTTASNSSTVGYNGAFYVGAVGTQSSGSIVGYISNVRVVNGTAVYTANFTPTTAPLTAIANTKLLTCQSNRFKDNSASARTMTINGSPQVQPFIPFEPSTQYSASVVGGSMYFDGTGDYISSSVGAIGTGDFTVEFFANLTSNYGGYFQISTTSGGLATNYTGGLMAYSNSGTLWFFVGNSPYATTYVITTGEWVHIALVRSSGTVKVYVNGVLSSTPVTDTTNISGTYVGLPGYYSTSYLQSGYISNFRVLIGTALYTSDFTPPTAPLTAISGTSLLLSGTNSSILDSSGSINFETMSNTQTLSTQYKFGSSSMYFDASSSYLRCPSNPNVAFGTGDFTIEYWMYSNDVSSSTQKGMLQISDTAGGLKTSYGSGIHMAQGYTGSYNVSGALLANILGTNIGTPGAVLSTGTWYHVALVRISGFVKLYLNGAIVASGSASGDVASTYLAVGGYYNTSYTFNGYIDDFRITKGVCRYPYNFTIPASAYPNY